ncbi:gluconokinase, GntK/IdnK-type [Pseudoxanthomonas sp. LH2527]|uniref:gluconokinase n=1 Tax=Pseudoxanthomonas sp. LH2527 TaxID=2923249 RepID=UPI001F144C09|nr:gluconokinase, GntK/IdnK-type [Pseudoxanthomonas sp. LH2527]MCH6482308.1 gluconokinase, GntK/IdnK-type [Pseudoxanthomonas sp. LH2527]
MNGRTRVVVVMGVSGSGKTTLARALADAWPATFLDADDFHSEAAKTRMAGGHPLTDRMRAPWVRRIAADLQRRVAAGERVVLAFSGLRRRHRDRLRATGLPLRFLFLQGDPALVAARMQARQGHYMPPSLLDSQFDALELPQAEPDVTRIAMDDTPAVQLRHALAMLD